MREARVGTARRDVHGAMCMARTPALEIGWHGEWHQEGECLVVLVCKELATRLVHVQAGLTRGELELTRAVQADCHDQRIGRDSQRHKMADGEGRSGYARASV